MCATFQALIKSIVFQKTSCLVLTPCQLCKMCESSGATVKIDQLNLCCPSAKGVLVAASPSWKVIYCDRKVTVLCGKNKTDKKLWAFMVFLCTRPTWVPTQLRVAKDQLLRPINECYYTVQTIPNPNTANLFTGGFDLWFGMHSKVFLHFLKSILFFC